MARHPVRNRVVAGAFLLLMAVAALAILILVGGWNRWFEAKQTIRVRFDAAPNIKIGSPVLLAGHPVGRVSYLQVMEVPCPVERQQEGKCYVIEVSMEIPQRYLVHQNARVTISQALVGQSALMNIEDVGFGELVKGFLNGEQQSAFAGAADELGIGVEEKRDISQILDNFQALTAALRKDLPDVVDKLKKTGANLVEASEKVKGTIGRVDGVLDENRENLKATIANARSMAEKADKGVGDVLDGLKASADKLQAIIDENRPDIRKAISHASSVAEKADTSAEEILANVRGASGDLKAAIADFKAVAGDAKAITEVNRNRVAKTMQNFHETSDHLKALAKEVRRAPWRLFAAPDKEEVESLNLYDTARAFAAAASDLDSITDTIQVMIEAKDKGFKVPQEVFDEMLKRLETTFSEFTKAEDAVMKEFDRVQK